MHKAGILERVCTLYGFYRGPNKVSTSRGQFVFRGLRFKAPRLSQGRELARQMKSSFPPTALSMQRCSMDHTNGVWGQSKA